VGARDALPLADLRARAGVGQELGRERGRGGDGHGGDRGEAVDDELHLLELQERPLAAGVVAVDHAVVVRGHVDLCHHLAVLLPPPACGDEDDLEGLQGDGELAGGDVRVDVEHLPGRGEAEGGQDGHVPGLDGLVDGVRVHALDFADEAQARVGHLGAKDAAQELLGGHAGGAEGGGEVAVGGLEDALRDGHRGRVRDAVA
jgi:hypothetical protein